MFGFFKRGIDIESGIFFEPGYWLSRQRPSLGKPMAELYALEDATAQFPENWRLHEQEKLSRPVRWKDDYFQYWAEVLAFGIAEGSIGLWPAFLIVGFDARGAPISAVEYRPVWGRHGQFKDIGYRDAAEVWLDP